MKTDLATGKVLQIIHIPCHWVTCQLFTREVHLYACNGYSGTLGFWNSTAAVFDQDDMRSHLMSILQNHTISETFFSKKKRKPGNTICD